MLETSARLLRLLALLQSRARWTGDELAARLGVTTRTVRHDVDRLRTLGYPVDSVRGTGGYYQLGVGTTLPPLLLDDDEAVAIAVSLGAVAGLRGIEETADRARAKLEQVLPHHLRRRVAALRDAFEHGPLNTDSNVPDPEVDPALIATIAAAIRDHESLRLLEDEAPRTVEPYKLVTWQRRWYVVARDPATDTWAPHRLDRITLRTPNGRRFTPTPLPGEDYTGLVAREVARAGWAVHTRITVHASAEQVLARINPAVGVVEPVSDTECVLVTGGDSVEIVAVYIGMLGYDFTVTNPPELAEYVAVLGRRYAAATH
ncbi:helix-turn-helix transcriptional regulator [Cellulomonas palmilytica]|uniref:helix-turn-helix transcriptional regulator n=1 Tax=Cellulomonas palmilytica TaxID=2608402 RepID=UPI001F1F0808|nr:WYL domain-containing protein [Cellulomonas palmilytica]UJP41073.1 WYL domain-containing protein [Cellulomonas palmilytica]